MEYKDWEVKVAREMKVDSLWKISVYRKALFLTDLCWEDVNTLVKDRRTISMADQLNRAAGSIGANIAEGYSNSTGKSRANYYQYALGSARESREWYYRSRHVLGDELFSHRSQILNEIISLLITMIPQQRGYLVREDTPPYDPGL
jgi:four helix bundle protein